MDYEKKYKEAMEKFKNFKDKYCTGGDLGFEDIIFDKSGKAQEEFDNIFPELKESEDERIRKEIIRVFKGETSFTSKKENEEYIAWLEKQVEQKPADKVEPKFKAGDFLVNDYCMGKVIELTNDAYLLDTGQGIPFSCEHNVHLWTIEDAKDGDVLCCESGWTCIFKALNSDISFSSYCFMDNTGWFCETGSESHTLEKAFTQAYNGNIHPATKAQRDTLEKAMADAGYTFDFKKKELKKIEQKPADKVEPKFKAGDFLVNDYCS